MTITKQALEDVIAELQPLSGGRIQRVDIVAERELVLELRFPGRTIRLLVSARPGAGRVHLVGERPPRELAGGDLQRALRRRLEGRPLVGLSIVEGRTIEVDARDARFTLALDGGKDALRFLPPSGREPPPMPDADRVPASFPSSDAIAARYAQRLPAEASARLKADLEKRMRTKRAKQLKLAGNIAHDRERLEKMRDARQLGELLKTVLHQIPRGATETRAMDWAKNEEVIIALDPALGAKQNMERYFARAKKAERGLPIVTARLAKVEAELAELDRRIASLGAASLEDLVHLAEAEQSGAPLGIPGLDAERKRAADPQKKKPIDQWSRRFEAADGTEIRVGKGAKENDRLTFSVARGDDVWLHARGTSGAHVLIRVQKGKTPSPEALLDAAHLAAHYSGASTAAKVEVIHTEARYVRKNKGDPPGRVSVARSKTILVAVDPARIDRLFGRGVAQGPNSDG